MNINGVEVLSIIAVISAGLGVIISVVPILKKKGINIDDSFKKADVAIEAADKIIDVAKVVAPTNPVLIVINNIEKIAKLAVRDAEQLYIASQLGKDERNAKAKDTIHETFNALNIEITPAIETIIDGAIESECLLLGHKDDSAKAIQTNLEQRNQALVEQNTQLQSNYLQVSQANQELQNKIATVQNTVGQSVPQ